MVVNPIDDNTAAWAAWFNAFANADNGDGIISGCSISKGTGDWDIDVTSGEIMESNTPVSISSDTVTLTAPGSDADMDAGESRVDLVHADIGDSVSVTEGTAASDPASPDIPSGEVLLGFVVVAEADSTAGDSDIFDVPALVEKTNPFQAPGWGLAASSIFQETLNSGTITYLYDHIEVRQPGQAASTADTRLYDSSTGFDPSVSGFVRVIVSNITIDDSSAAEIRITLADAPDSEDGGNDYLGGMLQGDGKPGVRNSEDGSASEETGLGENNAFANAVKYIELSWDGSGTDFTISDGSSTYTAERTVDYPSGENLFLKISARDDDGSNARNVDFDIESIVFG